MDARGGLGPAPIYTDLMIQLRARSAICLGHWKVLELGLLFRWKYFIYLFICWLTGRESVANRFVYMKYIGKETFLFYLSEFKQF